MGLYSCSWLLGGSVAPKQINVDWNPHTGQRQVLAELRRVNVLAAGRRWGKSELAAIQGMIWAARFGKTKSPAWVVAPTHKLLGPILRKFRLIWPRELYTERLSGPVTWTLPNGAQVEFRSGEDTGGLVGEGIPWLMVDEAARLKPRTWEQELLPTLLDSEAPALLISTPYGRNWFHDLWQRGQSADYPDYASWQFASHSNPHLRPEALDDIKQAMPERIFRQEILAEFVSGAGTVFPEVHFAGNLLPEPIEGRRYVMGVDLGRLQDFTVVLLLDADSGRLVHMLREQGQSWKLQVEHIKDLALTWKPEQIVVDATGLGDPILEALERAQVENVEGFKFTSTSKPQVIGDLILALEREELSLPKVPELRHEIESFSYQLTKSGAVTYNAPEGQHDDIVAALALANKARRAVSGKDAKGEWLFA